MPMNIFRALGDMSHLTAKLLMVLKLHASRSAAGVSLKTQKLYLLVFLARYSDLFFHFISWYHSGMKATYIVLTTTTIGMMRYRPSLRASYDASLDHFRMWMHAVIPGFVLAVVIFLCQMSSHNGHSDASYFVWMFSQVLEPLALVPQLLVFRGCTDAGRLAWIYVSLLVAYRGLYGLNWVYRAYHEPRYTHYPTLYVATAVHVGMYVVFMVDRKCRTSRHLPPDETGDMMEPNAAAREPLLEAQQGTEVYSGDEDEAHMSGSVQVSGGEGVATVSEARPPRGQGRRQGGEVENKIERVLMSERGRSPSPPGSSGGGGGGGTPSAIGPEGGMKGGSSGVFLV